MRQNRYCYYTFDWNVKFVKEQYYIMPALRFTVCTVPCQWHRKRPVLLVPRQSPSPNNSYHEKFHGCLTPSSCQFGIFKWRGEMTTPCTLPTNGNSHLEIPILDNLEFSTWEGSCLVMVLFPSKPLVVKPHIINLMEICSSEFLLTAQWSKSIIPEKLLKDF